MEHSGHFLKLENAKRPEGYKRREHEWHNPLYKELL
jgi:hypothetical protein